MKKMKKRVAYILTLAMVFCLFAAFPVTASAVSHTWNSESDFSAGDGDDVTVTTASAGGTLTISGHVTLNFLSGGTFAGNIVLASGSYAHLIINVPQDVTVIGSITGADVYLIEKDGPGKLILNGLVNLSKDSNDTILRVNEGDLEICGGTVTINATDDESVGIENKNGSTTISGGTVNITGGLKGIEGEGQSVYIKGGNVKIKSFNTHSNTALIAGSVYITGGSGELISDGDNKAVVAEDENTMSVGPNVRVWANAAKTIPATYIWDAALPGWYFVGADGVTPLNEVYYETLNLGITGPVAMRLNIGYTARATEAFTVIGTTPENVTQDTSYGGKITWNNTTQALDIAAGLGAGVYPVILTASDGTNTATHTFTLTVTDVPQTGEEISGGSNGWIIALIVIMSVAVVITIPVILKRRLNTNEPT